MKKDLKQALEMIKVFKEIVPYLKDVIPIE